MWGPKQEKARKPRVLRLYCWISSMRVSEEERSVRDGVQTCSSSVDITIVDIIYAYDPFIMILDSIHPYDPFYDSEQYSHIIMTPSMILDSVHTYDPFYDTGKYSPI